MLLTLLFPAQLRSLIESLVGTFVILSAALNGDLPFDRSGSEVDLFKIDLSLFECRVIFGHSLGLTRDVRGEGGRGSLRTISDVL